jgi:hypothetical protein
MVMFDALLFSRGKCLFTAYVAHIAYYFLKYMDFGDCLDSLKEPALL